MFGYKYRRFLMCAATNPARHPRGGFSFRLSRYTLQYIGVRTVTN